MTLYKNRRIDDWFKPFAQLPRNKRPSPEDIPERPPSKRNSPLGSPRQIQCADENGQAEALGPVASRALHSASQEQRSQPGDNLAESDPTLPNLMADGPRGVKSSMSTVPIHLSSNVAPQISSTPSSQSMLTSSQRIVRNGEVRIRDSDEESGSDTSLEDLDELLALFKPSRGYSRPKELDHTHPAEDDTGGSSSRRTTRKRPQASTKDSPLSSAVTAMPKSYKISLDSLAKQRKQYDASNAGVAQAKSVLDLYDQRKATTDCREPLKDKTGVLEADLINIVMKDQVDGDDMGRLKTAIHRTEALQHGKSWSFFEDYPEEFSAQHDDFPTFGNDHRLEPILAELATRQQAFLGGYIGEFARLENLPEELLLWLMDAVCFEVRDDLRNSYTATLNEVDGLYSLLTPERIDALFRKLGATATAIDVEKEIVPHPVVSQRTHIVPRSSLLTTLAFFRSAASVLGPESRVHLLCALCRLSLDATIATNIHAIRAIDDLFANLLQSIPEEDLEHEILKVLNPIYRTVIDTTLRLQLLQSIPALPPRLTFLRQRLALAFFFQDARLLNKQPEESVNLVIIAQHLQDPQFAINSATDYAEIAATIAILSIGIDCGDPPSQPCTKQEEIAFNKAVDNLALKIKAMFTQINDTGASHMKRTEAKETLEAFHSRLLFAVRTKPPPKKSIFGDSQVRSISEMFKMNEASKQNDVERIPNGIESGLAERLLASHETGRKYGSNG